ncbi:MAG: hypothetical protein LBS86_02075, partial [Treponema sp.]|nr:hypothetical protein [Treponema sp.]
MSKKLASGYCLCIIVLFMVSVLLRYLNQNVLVEILHIDNAFTQIIQAGGAPVDAHIPGSINWKQRYPFLKRDSDVRINKLDAFDEKITTIEGKIERYTSESLVAYQYFVVIAIRYELALGWTLDENIVDLGDGFIAEVLKQQDAKPYADGLAEFHDFLAELDIDLLYVQNPHKICKDDVLIGINNFSNVNADALLSALSEHNVPYFDFREYIHAVNFDHHGLFYKTDHHWKAETGLWASGVLAKYLNEHNNFSIDADIFSPDRYRYEVYEKWFLGSVGRKLTLEKAEPEDFSLIYPKEEADFSFQVLPWNVDTRGAFDVIYDYWQVEIKDYYFRNPYGAYTYGDNPLLTIHNHKQLDGKKVLFIKDSFV